MAASKNHLETIKSLLSHGADIGAKDSNDETPLYRAASEGCIEALEVRLQNSSTVQLHILRNNRELKVASTLQR